MGFMSFRKDNFLRFEIYLFEEYYIMGYVVLKSGKML